MALHSPIVLANKRNNEGEHQQQQKNKAGLVAREIKLVSFLNAKVSSPKLNVTGNSEKSQDLLKETDIVHWLEAYLQNTDQL